ncbi:AAA family ATPase [Cutibacterium sp. WCA-380-WT-3A]|uniref:DNA 3'-5' helicase n=1 Tax=Cutibacterium porci TaxID=2605781 RepID=A0A7K0J9D9_9ACTN|nr:3'-5' exonuclease [Cutibacterium porci]MSS46579.1 AAA family ATPase [Cutibacterium porci]
MAESTIVMSKQANKLDGSLRAKAFTFLAKLTENDETPGLHIEKVANCRDSRIRTGRVDQQYRAVLFKLTDGSRRTHYVLEGIYNHDEAYNVATRVELAINPLNGIPEIKRSEPPIPNPHVSSPTPPTIPVQESSPVITADRSEMLSLGLDANLVDTALSLTSEDAILDMAASLSGWQGAMLVDLASGMTPQQVRAELLGAEEQPETEQSPALNRQQAPAGDTVGMMSVLDESDAALLHSLRSPAAAMEFATIEGKDELRRVIEDGDFGAWRVFLHPTQRRFVNRRWNGSFRLSGGAGTGKTVVILHRAASLARDNPNARIIITTFTKNLANELSENLESLDPTLPRASALGEPGIYISGIDALASAVIRNAGPDAAEAARDVLGDPRTDLTGRTPTRLWQDILDQAQHEVPERLAHHRLLETEYEQIILPNLITTQEQYVRVRRPGRGFRLNRRDRDAIWTLVSTYRHDCRIGGTISFAEAAAIAGQCLTRHGGVADHVLVDEGQDLAPAHWRLIRSLVPEGPNDIFIAEDSHQRIYGHRLVLSRYGIMTRGRSRRLTLNYRTTAQILHWSTRVLEGGSYVDLDGADDDTLTEYRSARRGPEVSTHACATTTEEFDILAKTVGEWAKGEQPETTAILVRDRSQRDRVIDALHERGVQTRAFDHGPIPSGVPIVMTMHRAKGMEFSKIFLFGISSRSIPMGIKAYDFDEDEKKQALLRERSLLYVAASRARDELVVSWTDEPSPLLNASESSQTH